MNCPSSHHDEEAVCKFNESIEFRNGRYEVALPWKSTPIALVDNRKVALSRLHGLVRRLSSNEEAMRACDKAIRQYQKDDHAENAVGGAPVPEHVYYMPHRELIRAA